jgi:hypothetical protein
MSSQDFTLRLELRGKGVALSVTDIPSVSHRSLDSASLVGWLARVFPGSGVVVASQLTFIDMMRA